MLILIQCFFSSLYPNTPCDYLDQYSYFHPQQTEQIIFTNTSSFLLIIKMKLRYSCQFMFWNFQNKNKKQTIVNHDLYEIGLYYFFSEYFKRNQTVTVKGRDRLCNIFEMRMQYCREKQNVKGETCYVTYVELRMQYYREKHQDSFDTNETFLQCAILRIRA